MNETTNCKQCGREFAKPTSNAKFCSFRCRNDAHNLASRMPLEMKKCPVCESDFQGKKIQKFCSPKCRIQDIYARTNEAARLVSAVAATMNCKACNAEFTRTHHAQKFCQKCIHSRRGEGRRNAMLITAKCRECGVLFNSNRCDAAFCSQICREEHESARAAARLELSSVDFD